MRIGLIADIHGNFQALEVVLRELEQEHIEQIICLGDIGSLGPQPHEVVERLRDLGCPVIMGNTDEWLLNPPVVTEKHSESERILREVNAWCVEQLSSEDLAYIRTFSPTLGLPLDEKRTLLCYHGSPRSFDDVIAAVTPDTEVQRMLGEQTAAVMVGGHTHIQMIRRYQDAHLVNVGSVGLPGVNAGSPELPMNHEVHWAEYGVLSLEQGRLSIDLRRTPLDVADLLRAARRSDMPHADWWEKKWRAGA